MRLQHRTKIPHSTIQYWITRSVRLPPWLKVRALVHALQASEEVWLNRWRQVDRAP